MLSSTPNARILITLPDSFDVESTKPRTKAIVEMAKLAWLFKLNHIRWHIQRQHHETYKKRIIEFSFACC